MVIDTNILVHAINDAAPAHEACRALVEERRRGAGFALTWSILYEWLRVVTHPRVFERPVDPETAAGFARGLAREPRVDMLFETPQHQRFLAATLEEAPPLRGNIYHDAHTVALMREHGIRDIATADRHFRLFGGVKIIDPTA